jgi:hypothetical protein
MAEAFGKVAAEVATKNSSTAVSKPALTSLKTADDRESRVAFATTMAHLAAMKRTAPLSKIQLRAWYAILGGFPNWLVNRAVIEMSASETRFPEVGDLYRICRREAINKGILTLPYSPHGGTNEDKLTAKEIDEIGASLGLRTAAR